MAKLAIQSLQISDAFTVTPDDDNDVSADAGNTEGYKFCVPHVAGDGGSIKVTMADGGVVTVYCAQGQTLPIFVRRIWETDTDATDIVGFIGRQR